MVQYGMVYYIIVLYTRVNLDDAIYKKRKEEKEEKNKA